MWNNLKNKIKNLFSEEEIENIDHIKTEQVNKKKLEARVTYQYPKAPFRFPVIPDERKPRNTTSDVPVRKQNRPQRQEKSKTAQTNKHVRQQKNQTIQPLQKTYEQKQRFTPTQVASPIYGYQERNKEKTIHEVPAFVRKQKETEEAGDQLENKPQLDKSQEEMIDKEASATIETIGASTEMIINEDVEETEIPYINDEQQIKETINQENEVDKPLEEIDESIDKPLQERITEETIAKEKEQISDSEIRRQTREERRRARRLQQKQQKKLIRKQSNVNNNESRPIPFNVIMTPADKRNLYNKKKSITEKPNNDIKDVSKQKEPYEIPLHLLNDPEPTTSEDRLWVENQQQLLEKTLKHFNVHAKVVNASQGPSVTRFEVQPELGVKVSKVRNLSDDIKMNMAAKDIRIEAPIPGKNTIGIEVPNQYPQKVGLQEILETKQFSSSTSPLTIGLGLNVEGLPLITNISKMPHGLIAGATGSGKSVCINTILISLIYKSSYDEVKLMLIDPKMVELAPYNDIPHLVSPVITDVKAATAALKWAVNEMEDRYDKFVQEGVRDIDRYNEKMKQLDKSEEKMSFLVIVIDELADLMMASPQDVEDSICRIAQKARACGIHLLLATQRPSVDVITGLIKANIPSRIAFSVSSQVDSRTIIDTNGAERLLGKGDMLFIENGTGKNVRLQGAFVSDDEIDRVTSYVRKMASPHYLFEQDQLLKQVAREEEEDELLDDAIQFVFDQNGISTSLLQRQFRIGYNRAARLIDTMEQKGIISGPNGSKPREVLVSKRQLDDLS